MRCNYEISPHLAGNRIVKPVLKEGKLNEKNYDTGCMKAGFSHLYVYMQCNACIPY